MMEGMSELEMVNHMLLTMKDTILMEMVLQVKTGLMVLTMI